MMNEEMRPAGRAPAWSALESNDASLQLAAKLGFEAVDRIAVVSRGHWAFLTNGFVGDAEPSTITREVR
jgi:hypothetical protein